ncbi:MAG: cyclodeaminase/cyclohydrolase family protein [Haloarculaceae archaeon]
MIYREQSIDDFLDAVAGRRVTPAGGSATAVVGATGASLCEMVCTHTIEYDDHEETDLSEVREELHTLRTRLLDLADRDAEAVDALLAASDDDLPAAEKRATGVPLTIAEACLTVLEDAVVVTARGTPNAVPDAGTGAYLARGALDASLFTVRYNTSDIDDPSFVADMEERTDAVETAATDAFEQVVANVRADE